MNVARSAVGGRGRGGGGGCGGVVGGGACRCSALRSSFGRLPLSALGGFPGAGGGVGGGGAVPGTQASGGRPPPARRPSGGVCCGPAGGGGAGGVVGRARVGGPRGGGAAWGPPGRAEGPGAGGARGASAGTGCGWGGWGRVGRLGAGPGAGWVGGAGCRGAWGGLGCGGGGGGARGGGGGVLGGGGRGLLGGGVPGVLARGAGGGGWRGGGGGAGLGRWPWRGVARWPAGAEGGAAGGGGRGAPSGTRNRRGLDEIADHYSHGVRDEAEVIDFLRSGGNYLFESERQILGDLKPWCKRAIHLQCSGGLDGLSLLRQGAGELVGVDIICERLLASARRKAAAINARADWYLSDVLDTPASLDDTADLVYTGKGALCWMMNIDAWAAVVFRLLAPGGLFFLYEAHPLNWSGYRRRYLRPQPLNGNYFSDQLREGLPVDGSTSIARQHHWTLGQVVSSLCSVGLMIEQLHEYPEPFWNEFPNMPPETLHRLPHAYALLARKS